MHGGEAASIHEYLEQIINGEEFGQSPKAMLKLNLVQMNDASGRPVSSSCSSIHSLVFSQRNLGNILLKFKD